MLLLRPIRYLAEALAAESSSRQLALGMALGALAGLVPKGNLTAVVLMAILGISRANLGAGMLAVFVFSWTGFLLDPLTHEIGLKLLTYEPLAPLWTDLYDRPFVPWTGFNNTVVLGSLVFGVCLLGPIYVVSRWWIDRYGPGLRARVRKYKLAQFLMGAEWADSLGRT